MDQKLELEESITDIIVPENRDATALASGASVSLIGKITGRVIHLLGQIVLARYLGPEVFGLYAIGWTILHIIGVITPLGLHNGVIRFGSVYWMKDHSRLKSVLIQSISIAIIFGFFIGIIEFIAAPKIEQIYKQDGLADTIRLFALAVPFLTGLKVTAAATRVTQRMKFAVIAEDISQPTVNLLLIALVYFTGRGLLGVAASETLSFIFALSLAWFFLGRLFSDTIAVKIVARQSSKELMLFSLPTVLTGMFSVLIIWTDRLLLGFFRPAADVGIYQAVSQSSTLFAIILNGFNAMFIPMIASLYNKGETKRLNNLFKISTKWGLYLSLPIIVTIFFASKDIIMTVFGAKYIEGSLSLIILSVGQLVNVATGAVGFMLIMTGRQNDWLVISCLAWIINLILNLILIPPLGILGSAIATSISVSLLFFTGLFRVKHKLNMWPYDWRYIKGLVAIVFVALVLSMMNFLLIKPIALFVFLEASVAYIVFMLTLFMLGLDSEDKEFLNVVRNRFGFKTKSVGI
jgi:O-antigen/teichoic acid export membrane protein